jgi:ERCC4-related helicase
VKTPKLHRSELVRYVHRPELSQIAYPLEPLESLHSPLLEALEQVYINYELMTDPYVAALLEQHRKGCAVSKQLDKLWVNRKTYCYEQLRTLVSKAKDMAAELGTSAMEYYLHQCMAKFETLVRISDQQLLDFSVNERQHLLKLLRGLPFSNPAPEPSTILESLSRKTHILIDTLVAEANNNPEFTGLVFVEQRVWVAALAEILSNHPRTKNLLRIGTFVGTSQPTKRKANISSLAEPKNQQTTLEDFRAGTMNLILATTVLEEGIDVSGCHLVVCFERPKNLKSFVQRRGRARKQQSKYFIFTPEAGAGRSSDSWQALEDQMRRAYEDDMRRVKAAEENEQKDEDGERYFRVSSTG